MSEKDFPEAHFYDQDFVDLYSKMWNKVKRFWHEGTPQNGFGEAYFAAPDASQINLLESVSAGFFLVYSNGLYEVHHVFDAFYAKQEADGAIRCAYDIETGNPVLTPDNPEGLAPPLFAIGEFNLYNKVGNKKRLSEVLPPLERYFEWLERNYRKENGLYSVPLSACCMGNAPRSGVVYPIDFNCQMATAALYMSTIADILNDKETSFKYKRHFFSLKSKINQLMWNPEKAFYFDLDADGHQIQVMTLASYWVLISEVGNEDNIESMIAKLEDPNYFGTEHPFPSLAACEPNFSESGNGYCGSVFPRLTFMVIKGLEKYKKYELARECAIRHLYFIVDTLHSEEANGKDLYEAYLPNEVGCAANGGLPNFPRKNDVGFIGLSAITLMFENILGLTVNLQIGRAHV